jgi:tyrosine-protein phosphatase YwqE
MIDIHVHILPDMMTDRKPAGNTRYVRHRRKRRIHTMVAPLM